MDHEDSGEDDKAAAVLELNPQQIRHRAEKLIHQLQPAIEWDTRAAALQELITIVQTEVLRPVLPELLKQMKEPLRDQVQDRYPEAPQVFLPLQQEGQEPVHMSSGGDSEKLPRLVNERIATICMLQEIKFKGAQI